MHVRSLILVIACLAAITGCSPKVGSDAWCKKAAEKPSGDWTANEATSYATHCLFKNSSKPSD